MTQAAAPSRSSPTSTPTSPRCKPRWHASTNSASRTSTAAATSSATARTPTRSARASPSARSRPSTATTTTPSPATSTTAAARTSRPRTANSGSARSRGRSNTPTRPPRTSCANCPSTCASRSATTDVHLVHGSPRKVNEYLFEDKPARLYERLAAAEPDQVLVFGHTHKPGCTNTAACCSSTAAQSANPRTATPAPPRAPQRRRERHRGHDRTRRLRRRGRRRGPVRDHPHLRTRLRRALQPRRLTRRRRVRRTDLAHRAGLYPRPDRRLHHRRGPANAMFELAAISISTNHRASLRAPVLRGHRHQRD